MFWGHFTSLTLLKYLKYEDLRRLAKFVSFNREFFSHLIQIQKHIASLHVFFKPPPLTKGYQGLYTCWKNWNIMEFKTVYSRHGISCIIEST